MFKRIKGYIGLGAIWCVAVVYIIYAISATHEHRSSLVVSNIEITLDDSSQFGYMANSKQIRSMIDRNRLNPVGDSIQEVKLHEIESIIANNGFVSSVNAYTTWSGGLNIDVEQHKPVLRFISSGHNAYITEDYYTFKAPPQSSLYVPIVTGSYSPLFAVGYQGSITEELERQKLLIEQRIAEIKLERIPILKQAQKEREEYLESRKEKVKRNKWAGKSQAQFDQEVIALRKKKSQRYKFYSYQKRMTEAKLEKNRKKEEAEIQKQKKLDKNFEDLTKLITFVEEVESDSFWRSEIVQIESYISDSGAVELILIPRSGQHKILFGGVDDAEIKFDRLRKFYEDGLSRVGWNKFTYVDLRYEGQVVCR